jgi:hypothetical protein
MRPTQIVLAAMRPGIVYGSKDLRVICPNVKDPIAVLGLLHRSGYVEKVAHGKYRRSEKETV